MNDERFEPLIEKRIFEVAVACDGKTRDLNNKIVAIYDEIKILLPGKYFELISKLDEAFILYMQQYMELVYKSGYYDGSNVFTEMQNFKDYMNM